MNIADQPRAERTLTIVNQRGLHARAAAKFVKLTSEFKSNIEVTKDGETVSGVSIMGLMMLAAAIGSSIHVAASGVDAEKAVDAVAHLVESKFDED
ncbi:MAG: HPr family phosphocarrier protein [Alphaproteobacteria bacterium]|nr:HPr family phosphocarrier protein [Alphaproteobacteria bacterium]